MKFNSNRTIKTSDIEVSGGKYNVRLHLLACSRGGRRLRVNLYRTMFCINFRVIFWTELRKALQENLKVHGVNLQNAKNIVPCVWVSFHLAKEYIINVSKKSLISKVNSPSHHLSYVKLNKIMRHLPAWGIKNIWQEVAGKVEHTIKTSQSSKFALTFQKLCIISPHIFDKAIKYGDPDNFPRALQRIIFPLVPLVIYRLHLEIRAFYLIEKGWLIATDWMPVIRGNPALDDGLSQCLTRLYMLRRKSYFFQGNETCNWSTLS